MRPEFSSIAVKHNIEVAHRLFELPGKCEQIHGHSMWVTMHLEGRVNEHGILGGIEYGALKSGFRKHLDETYDHRLLLNAADPFARPIVYFERDQNDNIVEQSGQVFLPGLQAMAADPTTENIAKWVCEYMAEQCTASWPNQIKSMKVEVWETSVNMASHGVILL